MELRPPVAGVAQPSAPLRRERRRRGTRSSPTPSSMPGSRGARGGL